MAMKNKETIIVKVPSVLKDIPEKEISAIPNCCGAYVIKVESGKLYVGSSKTLRTRILAHKVYNDPNISEKIVSACYYQTNEHVDARILEYWLIREIDPVLNKSNNSDASHNSFVSKCSQNCKTWSSPAKNINFHVNVIEIYDNIPVDKLSILPKRPGAYVITTESGKLYVGSASNVCTRIASHNSLKGPSITEPIKSVNCYITENNTDALILEYLKIRELKPELNKEFLPEAWKWNTAELTKHFEKEPELENLFNEFSKRVCSSISELEVVVRKNWITYQTSALKNIFFVKFMSGYLQVDLKDKDREIIDSSEFSWAIEPTQASTFHRRFKLHSVSEIDKALEIVTQAYNQMK